MLTIVDDLVSVDELIESYLTVEPVNEYVQSCDIVAFNKICKLTFPFVLLMATKCSLILSGDHSSTAVQCLIYRNFLHSEVGNCIGLYGLPSDSILSWFWLDIMSVSCFRGLLMGLLVVGVLIDKLSFFMNFFFVLAVAKTSLLPHIFSTQLIWTVNFIAMIAKPLSHCAPTF